MPMRLMVDSVVPGILPVNVGLVAGYVNGKYKWKKADWDRFPDSQHVRYNVTGEPNRGNALDVERYDATAADAPKWWDSVTWCPKADLAIYCNRSTVPSVISAMGKRPWVLILATLDGSRPVSQNGKMVSAVQSWGAKQLGTNIDISEVFNNTWHKAA